MQDTEKLDHLSKTNPFLFKRFHTKS